MTLLPQSASAGAAAPAPARPVPATPELEALHRDEEALEAAWERLHADGHDYGQVRAVLEDAALPVQAREAVLGAAQAAQQDFLGRLDAYQRRLHAHFMAQVTRELDRAMETFRAFYGPRGHWRLRRRHRRLAALARRYRELEPCYGTEQDHRRIAVYQRFYAGVVDFSQRLRSLDPTMPEPPPPSAVEQLYRLRRGAVWLGRRAGALLRLVAAAVRVVATVFSARQPETGTPFTNRVDDFFRALGEVRGHAVVIQGGLPAVQAAGAEAARGTVTVWAPTHRHGVTDNITFAHVGLPDYLVFNAVDQVQLVPRFLKDRAARTNGLVPVGGGRGPSVDRALEMLQAGITANVLIYPEGTVSEGFRGTRPPRANFGEKLVRRIREAGRPVRIVPVAYPDNARFLDLPPRSRRPEDRRLRVRIAPPLEPAVVDALLAAGGGAFVNTMLRLAWLESLVTDPGHLLGLDRVRAIEARLDVELDGIRYWGSLESAPVRDRLALETDAPLVVREEPFRGKRVRVLRIPDAARDAAGRIRLPDLAAPDSNELLIGIRAPSHIYLAAGSRRFDGDIFRPLKVKERDHVQPGIVIRFLGVPVKSLHAIRRRLETYAGREERTLTCANSACQVIARSANIRIDDHADLRPFLPSHLLPTRTIRKLIERGARNHAGQKLELQIYKTDDRSLEEVLAACRREEIRIAGDHVRMLTVDAWRKAAAAVGRGVRRLRGRGAQR